MYFAIGVMIVIAVFGSVIRSIVVRGVLSVIDWYAAQRSTGAAECRRLASDADCQSAAFVSGDLRAATFGRYQPPAEVFIPPTVGLQPPWADDEPLDETIRNRM